MKYRYLLIYSLFSFLVDRITKIAVILSSAEISQNPGVAFGLANNVPGILFFLIALGFFGLVLFGRNLDLTKKTPQIALGLIFGGGVSNLLDRLFYGSVIDFIDILKISCFNLADVSILAGSIILLVYVWRLSKA